MLTSCLTLRLLSRCSAHVYNFKALAQPVCVYEASSQKLSSLCLWDLLADTQLASRGLKPLAQVVFVYEASKQILTLCLTIRLVWRHSVHVYLEGLRRMLLLCVCVRPLGGRSAPVCLEASRLLLTCVRLWTSRKTLSSCLHLVLWPFGFFLSLLFFFP